MTLVPAEVIWLPSVDLSFITQHFADKFGIKFLTEGNAQHSSEEEECFIKIFGKLQLKKSDYKCLIDRWCKQDTCKYQKWLSLSREIVFETYPTLHDKWIDVISMSFGTIVGLNKFAGHYNTNEQNEDENLKFKVAKIKVYFQHDIKTISIYFHVTNKNTKSIKANANTHRPHRIQFDYSAIDKVLINKTIDSNSIDVYFYISHPPLIYIVELPKDAENKSYENYINETPNTTYSRVDTFADCSHSDIGLSTILKLQFSRKGLWNAIGNLILNSKTTKFYFSPISELPKKETCQKTCQTCQKRETDQKKETREKRKTCQACQKRETYKRPKIKGDKFNCVYALESLLSRSWDVIVQIDERREMLAVNEKLNKYAEENSKALEVTLFKIFSSFEQKKIVCFSKALDFFYEKNNKNIKSEACNSLSIPKNMVEVRRAILTPTRIILLSPQPYFKCCFYRKFESEYTIRLSVKDDDISSLSFTLLGRPTIDSDKHKLDNNTENVPDCSKECDDLHREDKNNAEVPYHNFALEKVKKQFLKGFNIGKRHYQLLGCSSSHFREHGMIFYAKDSHGRDAKFARKDMGDFSKITKVPKYMARFGQFFSQSLDYIEFPKSKTKVEDDIIENSFEFSDGIGKISPSIAQQVFKKLDLKHNPSAFQIRYGGCKGMLTQWSDVKDEIIFRKSMNKFESKLEYLEILKFSKPRPVYLNRPFITILSQLGVEDNVFLNLQNRVLISLFNSLFDEENAFGILHLHSMLRIDYKGIFKAGIKALKEPFLLSMLKAIFEHNVVKLTTHARIQIPLDKGRTMFGVLDETKTLEYGEIFVQYTKDLTSEDENVETEILTNRIVVVTKNPCMHPGDVRKFEAVDVEALHHIKDCIVFPAKGHRPHPNEMAGSDLDGDEYSVIWEDELRFKCDNYDPMDFPDDDTCEKEEIKVSDMVEFFCQYVSCGQIGQIATAHLVWSDHDIDNGGIFSEKCRDLAHKYSVALDFAKSGKTARLTRDERPNIYPDYLNKGLQNNSYLSRNILGQLYRCSKTVQLGFEGLVCTAKYDGEEDLIYPGHEKYQDSARDALQIYNNEIDSILDQYGIISEGELLSGALLKTSKYICIKQDLNDLSAVEHRTKQLFKIMRNEFSREFINNSGKEKISSLIPLIYGRYKEEVFQKASAWYMVTCKQSMNEKTYFGLPWTIHDIICKLKEERQNLRNTELQGQNLRNTELQFDVRTDNILSKDFPKELNNLTNNRTNAPIIAFNIINRWLNEQKSIISNENDEHYDLIMEIYNEVTEDLEKQDNTEKFSVYSIVLKYLHKLSRLIFTKTRTSKKTYYNSCFLQEQIIGLLAFKTVLNILYCNDFNSSILAADMNPFEKVFRIPLDNDSMFHCIIHKKDEVKELLKEWAKVDDIEFRLKDDRQNKWYILFTVKGNKYALHHFQDIILQENFHKAIDRMK